MPEQSTQKRIYPKRLSVYLSDEVKAQLKELAKRQRRSMSDVAALLVEKGLKEAMASTANDPLLN